MPKLNNLELSTKDQINMLIGALALQYVNMRGNEIGTVEDPTIDTIKKDALYY